MENKARTLPLFGLLFFLSLFLFTPQAHAAANFTYGNIDVNVDCVSNEELDVTVDMEVDFKDVVCWWINYGAEGNNTSTTLTSFEVGTDKSSLKNFSLTNDGLDYKYSGNPPAYTGAIDTSELTIYISPGVFNQSTKTGDKVSERYTGVLYVHYKTKVTGNNLDGDTFSFVPFATNENSGVSQVTTTFNNLSNLNGTFVKGYKIDGGKNFRLKSSDNDKYVFVGSLDKSSSAKITMTLGGDGSSPTQSDNSFAAIAIGCFLIAIAVAIGLLIYRLVKK